MYVDADTVIKAAALLTALGALVGAVIAATIKIGQQRVESCGLSFRVEGSCLIKHKFDF